jgi:hypothetical protein
VYPSLDQQAFAYVVAFMVAFEVASWRTIADISLSRCADRVLALWNGLIWGVLSGSAGYGLLLVGALQVRFDYGALILFVAVVSLGTGLVGWFADGAGMKGER